MSYAYLNTNYIILRLDGLPGEPALSSVPSTALTRTTFATVGATLSRRL